MRGSEYQEILDRMRETSHRAGGSQHAGRGIHLAENGGGDGHKPRRTLNVCWNDEARFYSISN